MVGVRRPKRIQRERRRGGLDGKSNPKPRNVKLPTILFPRWYRSVGVKERGRGGGRDLMVVLLLSLRRGRRHSNMIHRGAYSNRKLIKS